MDGGMVVKRETMRSMVSNLILFLVSMTMVLGFFFHGEFYQIGLVPLLIIGGAVVFGVLKTISWANSELRTGGTGRVGNLIFDPDTIPSILYGEVTTTIRPLKKSRLRVGMLCNVRATVSGRSAGKVLITDVVRKRLDELEDRDTEPEGMDPKGFRKWWRKKYGGPGDQIVRIIHFRGV